MKTIVCLLLLLVPALVFAQDRTHEVALVKSELMARGEDLSGPCGAFKIVVRVAWRLRSEGYGLLGGKTPGQNGCATNGDKYSVDWILKPSGEGVDLLGDAGGMNAPMWNVEHAPAQFYRPAFDPGDSEPAPPPPPPPQNTDALLKKVESLEALFSAVVQSLNKQIADLNARIAKEAEQREWRLQELGEQFIKHKSTDPHFSDCQARIPWLRIPVSCDLVP